jgi:predicted GIY-YIG superfamily endonuclease
LPLVRRADDEDRAVTVYLIHLDRPLSPGEHTTQHYLGYTRDGLRRRLDEHAAGHGARMLQVANERGIGWQLVRTWPGAGRGVEHWLKEHTPKNGTGLCPICSPMHERGLHVDARPCSCPHVVARTGERFDRERVRRPIYYRHEGAPCATPSEPF